MTSVAAPLQDRTHARLSTQVVASHSMDLSNALLLPSPSLFLTS